MHRLLTFYFARRIALTALYAGNGWLGRVLEPLGIQVAFKPLGVLVALTFALGFVDGGADYAHWIRAGVFCFMASFALAAWVDLRCLRSMSPERVISLNTATDYENEILHEIAQRREKYVIALRITEATFILLIPFILLWITVSVRAAHSAL